ncbi:hypothetical protein Drorol1_Dr00012543 [Drosera rotundifolia]
MAVEPDAMSRIGDDILQNILSKLPAPSFASAACVSQTWNAVCGRVLSRPLLASALSLNPSLEDAVEEIVEKVLARPMRPMFAILAIEYTVYGLEDAHRLIDEKFHSRIPIITCEASGIIGRDAKTDELREVKFENFDMMSDIDERHRPGILLMVGYLPGLKLEVIPMYRSQGPMINQFITDIRGYVASVSGPTSPDAIIMFGNPTCDMKPVLSKMDCALSADSLLVGNEGGRFKYTSCGNWKSKTSSPSECDAVALVIARDKTNLKAGIGRTEFHLSLTFGTAAIGPTYKAVSVKVRSRNSCTWITGKREGNDQIFDGRQMLDDLDNEVEGVTGSELFVGLIKRRKCSFESEKVKLKTSVAYHHVVDADEQYLYLRGLDIKTGDSFRFHAPDHKLALSSCNDISENFRIWKNMSKINDCPTTTNASLTRGKEVIGAFMFTCCGRGESFFGEPNVDSAPILKNFPGIPLVGMFCCGEIGRGPLISCNPGGQGRKSTDSCLHVYSAVYLVLTYDPAPFMP